MAKKFPFQPLQIHPCAPLCTPGTSAGMLAVGGATLVEIDCHVNFCKKTWLTGHRVSTPLDAHVHGANLTMTYSDSAQNFLSDRHKRRRFGICGTVTDDRQLFFSEELLKKKVLFLVSKLEAGCRFIFPHTGTTARLPGIRASKRRVVRH